MIPTLDFGKGVLIQKSVPIRYYSLTQKRVLATSVHLAARERFEIHSTSVLSIQSNFSAWRELFANSTT
jgi:hypothetical protein